jgi:hypothetical protein
VIATLGLLGTILAASVIGVQMSRGRLFTLLTFHSALFILECGGGALKAVMPDTFPDFASLTAENPLPYVPLGLVIYIGGYALMLYGYLVATALTRRTPVAADEAMNRFFDRRWTGGYKLLLFLVTFFTITVGFIQHYFRVQSAGGLSGFLETAYQHRAGTATETQGDTALVVIGTVLASSALPLVLIWLFAWLRGRLGPMGKVVVFGLTSLLLFRQYTSMFRAVILLTLIAIFAAYISERRMSIMRWIAIGLVMFGLFVAVNFIHLYLYYLTADWNRYGLLQSMSQFLGPHGHLYTLSAVLAKLDAGAPTLNGTGMVESIFYFIPRAFWTTKLTSNMYGTPLVQGWADLPTHFQMAITAVGEWIAHFGYLGIALMFFNGMLFGWLDSFYDRGTICRAALFGLLIGRVLPDAGMGLSSIAITLTLLGAFLGFMVGIDATLAFLRWLFGMTRRVVRPQPRAVAALSGGSNAR